MEEYLTTSKWTPQELIECFSWAQEILPTLLEEKEEVYQEERERIKAFLRYVQNNAPAHMWFWEIFADRLMTPDLVKADREVYRIKRLIGATQGRQQSYSQESFETKLQRAREVPIYELARSHLELKSAGVNYVGLCPLHTEKRPSFYLYTASNRFHCFGCAESGDTIALIQKIYTLSFREAVEQLQNI